MLRDMAGLGLENKGYVELKQVKSMAVRRDQ